MTTANPKRGMLVGGLVFVVLLAVFLVVGTVEPWMAVVVCGGAYLLGRILYPS